MVSNAAVRRMILIHSGPYAYANFDLSIPTQVVAENNAGKTSLIAALQYLYVADRRQLKFNESDGPAAAFYFPYPNSCIVFEVDTPDGIRCVVVRGTGMGQQHGFERWVFNGPYDPALFFAEDQVRDPGDITAAIATERDGVAFSGNNQASDYARALTGLGRSDRIPTLGLVPVRQYDQYQRFVSSFQGLLNLGRLTQESLKTAAVELAGLEPDLELNIRSMYRERYDQLMRRWREYSRTREARPLIEAMVDDAEARDEALDRIPAAHAALEQHRKTIVGDCDARMKVIGQRLEELDSEVTSIREEENTTRSRRQQHDRALAVWQKEKEDLEASDRAFAEFDTDFARAAFKETENRYEQARQRYHQAPSGEDLADLQSRRKQVASQIADLERLIASADDMAVHRLREHHDDETLERVFRLINPQLLTATAHTVTFDDVAATARAVTAIDQAIEADAFTGHGARVSLHGLAGPDLANTADPAQIRQRRDELAEELERLDAKIADADRRDTLRADLDAISQQLEHERKQIQQWDSYCQRAERRPMIEEGIAEATRAIEQADADLKRLEHQIGENQVEHNRWEQELSAKHQERDQAIATFEQAQQAADQAADDWSRVRGPAASADTSAWQSLADAANGIHYLVMEARSRQSQVASQRQRLMDSRYGTPLLRDTDEATQLDEARERIDTLDDADAALRQDWHYLAVEVAQQAKHMINAVESVSSSVRRLNRSLAGMRISNLDSISIGLKTLPETFGGLEKLAQFADQQADLDLAGREGPADVLAWFEEQMTERPRFRLIDLFGLEIRTRQQAGSSRGQDAKETSYADVDAIGSNGTSIMVKIVLQVLLLRGLFRGDASEARLPFYLDEVASIDESNVNQLLELSDRIGCTPILAAPYPVEGVPRYHHLQRVSEGDAILDDTDVVDVRSAADEPEVVNG